MKKEVKELMINVPASVPKETQLREEGTFDWLDNKSFFQHV